MPLRRPLAVLFDLDGTLIDTAPEFVDIALKLRQEAGLTAMDPNKIRQSVSDGTSGMVQTAMELSPDDPDFEFWRQRFLMHYSAGLGKKSSTFPGLFELVTELDNAGIAWGVVTNKAEKFAQPLLNMMAFQPPPGVLITPDHVAYPKPDPEPILLACKTLGCPSVRTIYVGDHLRDIESGRAAGCQTASAAYGYLAEGECVTEWRADVVAWSASQLVKLIQETFS